jgi:lysophospholipase L1-like esterase
MRIVTRSFFLFCLLGVIAFSASSQQKPAFWDDIQAFIHQDSLTQPPPHAILFIGSSSFTKWSNVQDYFSGYPIINRGFGGSSLPDVIRYADKIIFPYAPRQVVIYCGDNDAASSSSITSDSILYRFEKLFTLIRGRLPRTKITYVSIKPSPSRARLMPVMSFANWKIRRFLKDKPRTSFVDVYHLMLQDNGSPKPDIFTSDSLHMNLKGYDIWQKAIRPHLLR